MNKNAIKNYAVWARNELIARVSQKAYEYGVTEKDTPKFDSELVNGKLLSNTEKKQLNELISQVNKHGFNHVMEEVAYTWFNRFIALRFMEVNNYLPQKINVFTDGNNQFKPQMISEAIHLEIDGVDKKKVFEFIEQNNQEELYKYLLLSVCNDMNNYLPDMFTPITDYKALLIPDHLLNEGSVLDRLIKDIPEEDWQNEEIENSSDNGTTIIGWMYQYYISERHNQVVNMNKGNIKKEDIPAATELWTTDWVVRYMVDNSLGRYWIERNPKSPLKSKLRFLATSKDNSIPVINETIKPETITFLDPCMGSGHILAYAFDVFMEIYRECGYSDRDAAESILENNLYGIDIDNRAYQLAYFSVMMKARAYNRKIMTMGIEPHLTAIVETNGVDSLSYFGMKQTNESKEMEKYLLKTYKDALELGSLIESEDKDYNTYEIYLDDINNSGELSSDFYVWQEEIYPLAKSLVKQADILKRKFTITTTNPPYMGKMEGKLKQYVLDNYKDVSSDLFAVFIKRNFKFTQKDGYMGFMTPFVWMFIKSYGLLREYIINNKDITTLIQMEYSAYEEATVPICSFVLSNRKTENLGYYYRLSDFKGGMEVQKQKVLEANINKQCGYFYETHEDNFKKIPGSPIAYWISSKLITAFQVGRPLSPVCRPTQGLATGDNGRFLRLWFEVCYLNTSFDCDSCDSSTARATRWFPYNKGGEFRKWYGHNDYVVNWENDGFEIRNFKDEKGKLRSVIRNPQFYFKECASWSKVSSGPIAFRYKPKGFVFDVAGTSIFSENKRSLVYILGLCNSNVIMTILKAISPTLNYEVGQIANLPVIFDRQETVVSITNDNISLSRQDWDSYETSWDFTVNPLIKQLDSLWDATGVGATIHSYYGKHIKVNSNMELCYHLWKIECNERFKQLKENEEELNRIFIDIYGLQDELTPEERDKDVTVHYVVDSKADIPESFDGSNYVRTKQDEIKSFISYAVGCMFGRYSLDVDGLAYAGGEWDDSKYKSFIPDQDDIIPIYEDEFYGDDDITGRFIDFVRVAFGEDDLEANLTFIADSLGGKGTPRKVIRDYFINDFFKDHCQMYQVTGSGKRPIYWQFDSGKKNGFKALVYIHRYKPDLIARMRTEYVHPQQARYRTQINMLENQIGSVSKSDEIRIKKEIQTIKAKADELAIYEEKIHHWADKMEPMDLDDGVVNNYNKFQELLVPNVVKKPKEK